MSDMRNSDSLSLRPVRRPANSAGASLPSNTTPRVKPSVPAAGTSRPAAPRPSAQTGVRRTPSNAASPTRRPVRPAGAAAPASRPAGSAPKAGSSGRTNAPVKNRAAAPNKGKTSAPVRRAVSSNSRSTASAYSRYFGKGGKKPDWPLLLMLAGCVIVLLGIISLAIFGIARCASGCDSGKNPDNPEYLQIVPSETATVNAEAEGNNNASNPNAEINDNPNAGVPAVLPAVNGGNLRSATIRSIGDFVIHKEIYMQANRLARTTGVSYDYNFAPMLNYVRDIMGNADFTVANVDGSLGGKEYYKYGYSGYPQFNTPPFILYALQDAGVDMLTVANNHMLDGWYDGLKATLDNLDKIGMKHVGAARTQEERDTPRIFEIGGIKVGFLNYTESLNSMDKAGVDERALQFGTNWTRNSDVAKDAKALNDAGAEVIICYMHWGEEYLTEPDENQRSLARKLVSAGVDVIVGGHPHVVQRAEWLTGTNQFGEAQETLCLFSLGNFLSDQRQALRDGGIIFDFTIQEQADGTFKIVNPQYLPTWVWKTGTDENNYTYTVLPIDQASANRPEGMNDTDYQTMVQSYRDSVAAMSKGVGSPVSE
ncbi:MAG: CapA family protein [Clostridia bacterium]|nr:CapA family protein [Clostridia bacterium]